MTLSEILSRLEHYDEDATIVAEQPWTPSSRAQVVMSPESGVVSDINRDGMIYFLEIAIAREFKEDWQRGEVENAFCERLIQYASNDA